MIISICFDPFNPTRQQKRVAYTWCFSSYNSQNNGNWLFGCNLTFPPIIYHVPPPLRSQDCSSRFRQTDYYSPRQIPHSFWMEILILCCSSMEYLRELGALPNYKASSVFSCKFHSDTELNFLNQIHFICTWQGSRSKNTRFISF